MTKGKVVLCRCEPRDFKLRSVSNGAVRTCFVVVSTFYMCNFTVEATVSVEPQPQSQAQQKTKHSYINLQGERAKLAAAAGNAVEATVSVQPQPQPQAQQKTTHSYINLKGGKEKLAAAAASTDEAIVSIQTQQQPHSQPQKAKHSYINLKGEKAKLAAVNSSVTETNLSRGGNGRASGNYGFDSGGSTANGIGRTGKQGMSVYTGFDIDEEV